MTDNPSEEGDNNLATLSDIDEHLNPTIDSTFSNESPNIDYDPIIKNINSNLDEFQKNISKYEKGLNECKEELINVPWDQFESFLFCIDIKKGTIIIFLVDMVLLGVSFSYSFICFYKGIGGIFHYGMCLKYFSILDLWFFVFRAAIAFFAINSNTSSDKLRVGIRSILDWRYLSIICQGYLDIFLVIASLLFTLHSGALIVWAIIIYVVCFELMVYGHYILKSYYGTERDIVILKEEKMDVEEKRKEEKRELDKKCKEGLDYIHRDKSKEKAALDRIDELSILPDKAYRNPLDSDEDEHHGLLEREPRGFPTSRYAGSLESREEERERKRRERERERKRSVTMREGLDDVDQQLPMSNQHKGQRQGEGGKLFHRLPISQHQHIIPQEEEEEIKDWNLQDYDDHDAHPDQQLGELSPVQGEHHTSFVQHIIPADDEDI